MNKIDLAYLPVVGRGLQIKIICEMHNIGVNYMLSNPMGEDFDKDNQAPFGTIPWMKDNNNGLELNDSMAIVLYLVSKYPGPLTPQNSDESAIVNMYWAWAQDYYSFVLSPFHDIITGHNEPFWRNLRLTDTLADGGKETGISNLTKLHNTRTRFLEKHLSSKETGSFLTGSSCSYADIFLYTCVRTVQETGGFGILRESCNGEPFKDCPTILRICNEVGKIDAVTKASGDIFEKAPI
jgi:glutathione S-transferase